MNHLNLTEVTALENTSEKTSNITTKILTVLKNMPKENKVMLISSGEDLELIDVEKRKEYLKASENLTIIEKERYKSDDMYEKLHNVFLETRTNRLNLSSDYVLLYIDNNDDKKKLKEIINKDQEFSVEEIQKKLTTNSSF